MLHAYSSVYLVAGDDCSILIEGAHPRDIPTVERQIEGLLAKGVPPIKYLFTTHTEVPHCADFGRMLERYPDAVAVGDASDLHLVFPNQADRLRPSAPGDRLDLGGREIVIVEAVFRDYIYTRWAFDTQERVLFTGDGLAYTHYHEAGHCGSVAEEVPDLNLPDMTALFSELAFTWTRYVDIEPYIERMDHVIFEELNVSIIAPTHGLPITDPLGTMPAVREGLRAGSVARSMGSIR
jgi:flavorubredoxin